MKNGITYKARIVIIRFAKTFPFILCTLVLLSYVDCMIALATENFASYGNFIIPYTPFSWFIGKIFEYGIYSIILALILSCAMETCIYNRLCVLYLFIHLIAKHYILQVEMYEEYIYMTCAINIIICSLFVYKGFKILCHYKK